MNLFILGNGFDIAHKLPTRYLDFKMYFWEEIYQKPYNKIDEKEERKKGRKIPELPTWQIHTSRGKLYDRLGEYRMLYW